MDPRIQAKVDQYMANGLDQSAAMSRAQMEVANEDAAASQLTPELNQAPAPAQAPAQEQAPAQGAQPQDNPSSEVVGPSNEIPVTQSNPSKYQYVNTGASDSEALFQSLLSFGLQTLAMASNPNTQNWGQAIAGGLEAGSSSFFNAINRNKRFNNISNLEAQGYNQVSIDEYIKTGDPKVLNKQKTSWVNEVDPQTGNTYAVLVGEDNTPVMRDGKPVSRLTALKDTSNNSPYSSVAAGGEAWIYNKQTGQYEKISTGQSGSGGSSSGDGKGTKSKSPSAVPTHSVIDAYGKTVTQFREEPVLDEEGKPTGEVRYVDAQGNEVPAEVLSQGTVLPVDKTSTLVGEQSKGASERKAQAKKMYRSSAQGQRLAREILDSDPKELSQVTGQWDARMPTFRNSSSKLEQKLGNLGGQTFLAQFDQLRGGGAITNAEGSKAVGALLRVFNGETGELLPGVTAEALRDALIAYDKMMEYNIRVARLQEKGEVTIEDEENIANEVFGKGGNQTREGKPIQTGAQKAQAAGNPIDSKYGF